MTELRVKIDGIEELTRALNGNLQTAIERAAFGIAQEVVREVSEYPPISEANVPKTFMSRGNNRWYQRGYGSRWARKDGGIGGRKTSEVLDKSWGVDRIRWGARIGSKASYAPVVHNFKEQASFHKRRGWVTDRTAVRRVRRTGKMDRIIERVMKRMLKG